MRLTLTRQGTLLKVSIPEKYDIEQVDKKRNHAHKRGNVTVFSKGSRKRLLQLFSKINAKRYLFITMTYGQRFPDTQLSKIHLANFIKRMKYRYPSLCGVWRVEYQKRGAPHFHLILMNTKFIDKDVIVKLWEEVIGEEFRNNTYDNNGERCKTFTRIEGIKKHRKVMSYVAKYVAKVDKKELTDNPVSEHKQNVRLSDDKPAFAFSAESAIGFNNVTYQTEATLQSDYSPHVGRWWGIIGKEFIPFAPLETLEFNGLASTYYAFRNYVHGANRFMRVYRANAGMSLMCDCAGDWFKLFSKIAISNTFGELRWWECRLS